MRFRDYFGRIVTIDGVTGKIVSTRGELLLLQVIKEGKHLNTHITFTLQQVNNAIKSQ